MVDMTPTMGYAFLVINGIFLVAIGYTARRSQVRNFEDFEVAGRRVRWPLVAGSFVVTFTWASTILVAGEAGYNFGWPALWIYPISAAGFAITVPVWLRIKRSLPDGTTYPEFVRLRFGRNTHILTTLVTLAIHFIVLFYLIIGLGFGFSPLFGLQFWEAVVFGGAIIILFTVLGGLWSSLMTDYFQYLVVWVVVSLVFVFGTNAVGGLGAVYDNLASQGMTKGFALVTEDSFFNYFFVYLFGWLFYPLVDQTVWQRVYAIEDPEDTARTISVAMLTWAFLPAMGVLIGIIGAAGGVGFDSPSEIVAATVSTYAPAWLVVLFALLVFNAIASTLGSMLVAMSGIITKDIYDEYIGDLDDDRKMLYDQVIVVAMGALVIFLAVTFRSSILAVSIFLGAFYVVISVPTFVAFVWPRAHRRAVFASIAWGFAIALSLGYAVNFDVVNEIAGVPLTIWGLYAFMMFSEVAIIVAGSILLGSDAVPIEQIGERAAREGIPGDD
jgi:Na+/proline symporter